MHQVPVVLEDDGGLLQHPVPFYIDRAAGVHQDVVDGRILQQRLQRAKAEDFIQYLLRQPVAFRRRERNILLPDQLVNHASAAVAGTPVLVHLRNLLEIQTLDEPW